VGAGDTSMKNWEFDRCSIIRPLELALQPVRIFNRLPRMIRSFRNRNQIPAVRAARVSPLGQRRVGQCSLWTLCSKRQIIACDGCRTECTEGVVWIIGLQGRVYRQRESCQQLGFNMGSDYRPPGSRFDGLASCNGNH
jgi:hypothetical protein